MSSAPHSRPEHADRLAVAYVRRSTDRQEQSLGDQRRAIESYAKKHGYDVQEWYEDDGISGTTVEARKDFRRMLVDAQAPGRTWRFILVFDVSRFSRGDPDEAGHLRYQFRQAGVEVIYCNEGLTGTRSDGILLAVKQSMAEQAVVDLSWNTLRGQISYAETGCWSGGTPPYGYDVLYTDAAGTPQQIVRWRADGEKEVYSPSGDLIRILPRGSRVKANKSDKTKLVPSLPERVAVIQRIFSEYVEEGRGFKPIVEGLNRDGIPSPRNGKWSKNTHGAWSIGTIRAILRNPNYTGSTTWNRRTFAKFHSVKGGVAVARDRFLFEKPRENDEADWVVVSNTHKALVSTEMFHRAQELMKQRGKNAGPRNFRAGSGIRSPYLLSGMISCGRCGQSYQGRVVNASKKRKDGSRIRTHYYGCGGYIMKGPTVCEKLYLRKDPLEAFILDIIQGRVETLRAGEGEKLLRAFIAEEIAAQGQDPRREMAKIRARLAEIQERAGVLMDTMTPETKDLVNDRLREMATEKRRLAARLEALQGVPYEPLDADGVLAAGMASLANLPRLMASGSPEQKKEFVNAFIAGITVHPDDERLDVAIRKLPATVLPQPGDSSVGVVAGARYDQVQIIQRVPFRGQDWVVRRAA